MPTILSYEPESACTKPRAKTYSKELVERVENGEEIVITRRGEPAARLVPERQGGGFVSLAGDPWRGRVRKKIADATSTSCPTISPRVKLGNTCQLLTLLSLPDTHVVLWWMAGERDRPRQEEAAEAIGAPDGSNPANQPRWWSGR